jgi:hypothetical protein
MRSSHLVNQFDADTRWELREWLNNPWYPPFDESDARDLFAIFTVIPLFASIGIFFYNIAVMLNQGHFDWESVLWAGGGLAFAIGWLIVKMCFILKVHHEPLHYITEAQIKDHTMTLLYSNPNYLGVAETIKEKLNNCDERWAQKLLLRLKRAVEQRNVVVQSSYGAQSFVQNLP